MFMSATRGEIFAMVDIEKPGNEPGSRSENITYYTHLPRYKPAAQLLALLREQYATIRAYTPLTIGVHDTVRVNYPLFSRTAIRIALKFHTHSSAYLRNLATGSHRHDLAGQPWGLITPEHQQQAREKLATRRQAPKPTPRSSEIMNTVPVEAGDTAGHVALARRLNETRPRLTLKRKQEV
jgi:sRNA-binding protein